MNGPRGEIAVEIEGQVFRLCLTLGALAEIETALSTPSLAALTERLKILSACDLLAVFSALLRGGCEPSAAQLAVNASPHLAAKAVADAFCAGLEEG